MKRENFFEDNPDLAFHFEKRIDWKKLYEWLSPEEREVLSVNSPDDYRKTWTDVLSTLGEICGTTIAPNAVKVEKEDLKLAPNGDVTMGPALSENMRILNENAAGSLGVHPRFGGLGAPFFVECAAAEMISRACPSTYLNVVWYSPVAHIIDKFGDEETKQTYIPKIAAGEWSGSMALTEPDAGSDLGALRTYGQKGPDGKWRIYGSKRFISNGSSEMSLVLAKNGKEAKGLKALSLFLAPRKINDQPNFMVTKLEDKVGLHGSATCELQFDGSDAVLLGKEGEGFLYMLRLMNDARIAVGLQGVGMMEAIHRLARDYAEQRQAWGKVIAKHELIAEMLLDMEVETKAIRSLSYQASYYQSMMYAGERRLEDPNLNEDERISVQKQLSLYRAEVRKWTPLIKWWVGEKVFAHARTGVQIHGGYGFTKEYRAEWWVRESLIVSLYEGTSQIQALMCIKDTMKDVIRKPSRFIDLAFGDRLRGLGTTDPLKKKLFKVKQIYNSAVVSLLVRLVKENVKGALQDVKPQDVLRILPKLSRELVKFESIGPALLHAERICEMKCYTALANCVVRDAAADPSRQWIAERLLNKAIPRLQMLKAEIEMDDPVIAERLGLAAEAK